ncbi:TPA: hypothetical protein NJ597_001224 [Vibrio parahaemolyticus]|nr:hypothetical protein [Vibrio parahaemolyticus]
MNTNQNNVMFNPSSIDEMITQQINYYDDFVKVKDKKVEADSPSLFSKSPEELVALSKASDNPVSFLEEIDVPNVMQTSQVDNIEDKATLDSILSTLANNPDFDNKIEPIHRMVGELISQVQQGVITQEGAQEQLMFNILDLFEEGVDDD